MYKNFKNIAKHTLIYGTGTIINKLVAFFLIPLYTRFLTPRDYGTLDLLFITIGILSIIIQALLNEATTKFYFDYKNLKDRNQVISSSILITFIGFFVILLLSLFSTNSLSKIIFQTTKYNFYFKITLLILAFQVVSFVPLTYLRIQEKSIKFITISLLQLILAVGLNIFFIVFLKLGILGILFSSLIISILLAVYLVHSTLIKTKFSISSLKIKKLLTFGLPLVPAGLFYYLTTNVNRFILQRISGLSSVGLYTLGFKFGNIINVLITASFMYIFSVYRYSVVKNKNGKKIISKILTYSVLVISFLSLIVALFIKEILGIIVTSSYFDAYKVVPIILLSFIFFGMFKVTLSGIYIKGKTIYELFIHGATLIIAFLSSLLLISKLGVFGAGLGLLVSYIFQFFLTLFFSQRLYFISYEFKKIFLLILISILIYFLSLFVPFQNTLLLLTKILLIFLFLFALSFFNKKEINILKKLFLKKFIKER